MWKAIQSIKAISSTLDKATLRHPMGAIVRLLVMACLFLVLIALCLIYAGAPQLAIIILVVDAFTFVAVIGVCIWMLLHEQKIPPKVPKEKSSEKWN